MICVICMICVIGMICVIYPTPEHATVGFRLTLRWGGRTVEACSLGEELLIVGVVLAFN